MPRQVRTFHCGGRCGASHRMNVHADGPNDPGVIDRFRLLAASTGWVIDLDGQAWCPDHREMAAC